MVVSSKILQILVDVSCEYRVSIIVNTIGDILLVDYWTALAEVEESGVDSRHVALRSDLMNHEINGDFAVLHPAARFRLQRSDFRHAETQVFLRLVLQSNPVPLFGPFQFAAKVWLFHGFALMKPTEIVLQQTIGHFLSLYARALRDRLHLFG